MEAIIDNRIAPLTETSTEPPPSLLVLILDTSPLPWHTLSQPPHSLPLTPTAISQLLLFINAHLALSHENRVAVLASHCGTTHWLYPAPSPHSPNTSNNGDDTTALPTDANKFRPFAIIEHTILTRLSALLATTTADDIAASDPDDLGDSAETPIAGALTTALSYVNRTSLSLAPSHPTNSIGASAPSIPYEDRGHGETTSKTLDARILIVSVSGDLAGQYVSLMNAMFAAQSLRVPIDVLKLAGDAVLLQQIAHTTGGVFVVPVGAPASDTPSTTPSTTATTTTTTNPTPPINGTTTPTTLLPALFQALLPTPTTRTLLNSPSNPGVDFRAACFCHKRVVDLGFVCSICLSIFCDEGVGVDVEALGREAGKKMSCLTCGSALVLAGSGGGVEEGEGKRKKKKKRREGEGAVA